MRSLSLFISFKARASIKYFILLLDGSSARRPKFSIESIMLMYFSSLSTKLLTAPFMDAIGILFSSMSIPRSKINP